MSTDKQAQPSAGNNGNGTASASASPHHVASPALGRRMTPTLNTHHTASNVNTSLTSGDAALLAPAFTMAPPGSTPAPPLVARTLTAGAAGSSVATPSRVSLSIAASRASPQFGAGTSRSGLPMMTPRILSHPSPPSSTGSGGGGSGLGSVSGRPHSANSNSSMSTSPSLMTPVAGRLGIAPVPASVAFINKGVPPPMTSMLPGDTFAAPRSNSSNNVGTTATGATATTAPVSSSPMGGGSMDGYHAEDDLDDEELDITLFAKQLFDVREYNRCAAHLSPDKRPPLPIGTPHYHRRLFIRGYATFMAGEKQKEDETNEKPDTDDRIRPMNTKLRELSIEWGKLYQDGSLDAHNRFLYGLILKAMDQLDDAAKVLVESVNMFPYNWSAWKTLASVLTDFNVVNDLPLEPHWMKEFFLMEALHERHATVHDPYVLLHSFYSSIWHAQMEI
jgi:hypothetical protein